MKKRDDDLPSSSSADYFNADHGKAAHQEKQAREKGKLSQLKRELLKADMNPDKAATVGDIEEQEKEDAAQDALGTDAEGHAASATSGATQEADAVQHEETDAGKSTAQASMLRQLQQKVLKQQTKPERASGSND